MLFHIFAFADCKCNINGTNGGSNVCAKSYQTNGSCFNQPGCKRGYTDIDCGTCDSELGYGVDEDGNCNMCIDTFFVKRNDTEGRPVCIGMKIIIKSLNEFVLKVGIE